MKKCPSCGYKDDGELPHEYFGDRPYGLMANPVRPRETVKNYEEIATIDTICSRWRAGDSLHAIRRWLDGIGVTTRKGTPWHTTQIKRILIAEGVIEE